MIQLIVLFFPAMISVCLFNAKKKNEVLQICSSYIIYNVFINVLVLLTIIVFKDHDSALMNASLFTVGFSMKYLLLAIVYALILPYLYNILKESIEINFDVKKLKR